MPGWHWQRFALSGCLLVIPSVMLLMIFQYKHLKLRRIRQLAAIAYTSLLKVSAQTGFVFNHEDFYSSTSGGVMFLTRDAMHKHGLCRHALSVRLSVHHVYVFCRNEYTYVQNFFTIG